MGIRVNVRLVRTVKKTERRYVNLSIPTPLYERLIKALEGTGYRSPTEYIVYLVRRNLPDLESSEAEKRLRALGYLSQR